MIFTPHSYQRKAIDFVVSHPYAALFLDMGLGKTVITLTAVAELIRRGDIRNALVVAPKKVAEATWAAEAAKWQHTRHLRVSVVLGTAKQREKACNTAADIYVTSRDLFVWICEKTRCCPDMVVLDELTSFKNTASKRFKAFRKLRKTLPRVVGLTGTPAPNGLVDIFAQIYCIDRGACLGSSKTAYLDKYFHLVRWNNVVIRATPREGAQQQIYDAIAPVTLTMRAEDYLDLPPMLVQDVAIDLSKAAQKVYNEIKAEGIVSVQRDGDGHVIMSANAAALINKLCQIANGAVYDDEGDVVRVHDDKADMFVELVQAALAGGDHVLVFYQYKHDLALMQRKELQNYTVRQYRGEQDLVEWNNGKIDVMFAHPASTAYGINMQHGGSVIIWYGTGYNCELYNQGNARLHRQGQSKPTRVIRLYARGTADEVAVRAIDGKDAAQSIMLQYLNDICKS